MTTTATGFRLAHSELRKLLGLEAGTRITGAMFSNLDGAITFLITSPYLPTYDKPEDGAVILRSHDAVLSAQSQAVQRAEEEQLRARHGIYG